MSARWPLPEVAPARPAGQGAFGAHRRYDIHTGVDLYCPEGSTVAAITGGRVVAVLPFTGPLAESPWWLPTEAVMIEDPEGVWLYGELSSHLSVGQVVSAGDRVGQITRVLRHDKGKPTTMLHLERYAPGAREPVWWRHDEPMPELLRDPTALLEPLFSG